jgi:hypothetical protein
MLLLLLLFPSNIKQEQTVEVKPMSCTFIKFPSTKTSR